MNICHLLHATAQRDRDAPAMSVETVVSASYGELSNRVARLAGGFAGLGLVPGDRVALLMRNRPEFIECLWACWHAGLVAVPTAMNSPAEVTAHILRTTNAKAVIADNVVAQLLSKVRALDSCKIVITPEDKASSRLSVSEAMRVVDTPPEAPAWLFPTSGTTGLPKIAVLPHRSLFAMTWRYFADVGQLSPHDTMLHISGLTHASGLYHIPHVARGSRNVIPASGAFDPAEALSLAAQFRNVAMIASPSMLVDLSRQAERSRFDPSVLRTLFYGSAPARPADLKRALAWFGPVLWQGYGQGETPMTISHLPYDMHLEHGHPSPWEQRLASVGFARTGVQVRVVDKRGLEVPPGEIGEVVCQSDVTMSGYWNDTAATTATLVKGWLRTGDLGQLDAFGLLTLKARSSELIVFRGNPLYPRDVEDVLVEAPHVIDAAVVGQPDDASATDLVALIVPAPNVDFMIKQVIEYCRRHLPTTSQPAKFMVVPSLPRTAGGKIIRSALRRYFEPMESSIGLL